MACEIVRRGRYVVGEPFFEPGLPIALGRRGAVDAAPGDLALVERAPQGNRGRVLERLGHALDVEAQLAALAAEAGARRPFPAAVEAEAEALLGDPGPPRGERRDLRDRLAFTIDPGSAKDHDDALTIEREGDGWRVLVHIADVAAAVPMGSALDEEARRRAFSVYLPGRVEPMLPHALSSGLCSLVPGRPRDTLTVELLFAADGSVRQSRFGRAQIVSARRFSYDEVERILAGAHTPPELREALEALDRLATILRDARAARGALMLAQSELELEVGEGRVLAARVIGEPRAHALVEELMIAANEAVAQRCLSARAPALYRAHEPPDPDAVEALYARLEALDVPTPPLPDVLGPREAARAAARAAQYVERHAAAVGRAGSAWIVLVLRSLQQARYDPAIATHTGLMSPAYCHFTSPIRRYPDLVVHRALLAALGADQPGEPASELADLAAHTSAAERAAEALERRGDALALAHHLADHLRDDPQETFAGEITGLIGGGAFIRFGGLYEGFLPVRRLREDYYDLGPLGVDLVGRSTGHRVRLGDEVRVRVDRIEAPRGRVTLDPVS